MKILFLTFYYKPDLCAGSFRNSPLVDELSKQLNGDDQIHVLTTMPNRYSTFKEDAKQHEVNGNIEIDRISLPEHKSGFIDQAVAFKKYYSSVLKLLKNKKYDIVYASSSRLFTAFLGNRISRKMKISLYLDIRDIFYDTMNDVIKNKIIKYPLLIILKLIEKRTIKRSSHLNLISGGFNDYFSEYTGMKKSNYTNGIDNEFYDWPSSENNPTNNFIITYAGNIGEGQGLHRIIPAAAKELGEKYKFKLIGDGGKIRELREQIYRSGINNVELLPPTDRKQLIQYYKESHFLFIHLNDYKAFEKVLPSKIFEYGATDKPIIAGVSGFSEKFIKENLENIIHFKPGDVSGMVNAVRKYEFKFQDRREFCNKYLRKKINKDLSKSILELIEFN